MSKLLMRSMFGMSEEDRPEAVANTYVYNDTGEEWLETQLNEIFGLDPESNPFKR